MHLVFLRLNSTLSIIIFKVIVKLNYLTDAFFNLLNSHELLFNFYNNDIHQNNQKLKSVKLVIRLMDAKNKFI